MDLERLIDSLERRARLDKKTIWHAPIACDGVEFCEESLGVEFPEDLSLSYRKIGNGGFGPGYGIIGLPGGHKSSWGDLLESTEALREDSEVEEGWIPIIDFGCAQFLLIDCDNEGQIVSLYDGNYHPENYDFKSLLMNWLDLKIPNLHSGDFTDA